MSDLTDAAAADLLQLVTSAISNPGSVLPRDDAQQESVTRWAGRAVLAALEQAGAIEAGPGWPTQVAYDKACEELWGHRDRADTAEARLAAAETALEQAYAQVADLQAAVAQARGQGAGR